MTTAVGGRQQLVLLFLLLPVSLGVQLGTRGATGTDCTSGFISLDRLVVLATHFVNTSLPSGRQSVFPSINFTCNGVITEWTVLAARPVFGNDTNSTLYPDLQVWRRNKSPGAYSRVGNTTLSEELSEDMYDIYVHTLDSPLEFQAGDVFGIFQPQGDASRLQVGFQRNGPRSLYVATDNEEEPPYDSLFFTDVFTDYPLVAIKTDPQECVSGSASIETLRALRDIINPGIFYETLPGYQSVSPQISFTCDGSITKWIVGAFWYGWNKDYDLYPELQVWRRVNESTPNSYHRVGNTVIAVAMEKHIRYEYPVDPPLPVKAGDVLGIYQPPRDDSRLSVLYERNAGPVTLLYRTPSSEEVFPEAAGGTVFSHSSLPLVTVEIVRNTHVDVAIAETPVLSSFSISETPGGGVDTPASFPAAAVGAGVAVGVVMIVAIVTLSAVVFMLRNHKKRNYSSNDSTNAGDGGEVKSSEACVEPPSVSPMVKNEAYGIAKLAQPIEIHGNEAYQTAAEAIAMEQNEAYGGRVERIDHTHTTTADYEEISAPAECDYVEII